MLSFTAGSGFKCGNDDFYEFDFSPVGICNEEDDGTSFKYSLDDCSTSGKAGQLTFYYLLRSLNYSTRPQVPSPRRFTPTTRARSSILPS